MWGIGEERHIVVQIAAILAIGPVFYGGVSPITTAIGYLLIVHEVTADAAVGIGVQARMGCKHTKTFTLEKSKVKGVHSGTRQIGANLGGVARILCAEGNGRAFDHRATIYLWVA